VLRRRLALIRSLGATKDSDLDSSALAADDADADGDAALAPAAAALRALPDPLPAAARDDAHLAREARGGDLDAFNLLVLRHERAVFGLCLRLLGDVAAAEDAAQDTFVKAWRGIGSFRGEAAAQVRPWLLRIAANRCYDGLRGRGRRPPGPLASLDAEPFEVEPFWSSQADAPEGPEAHALRAELAIHLERALTALPADQRLVVLLADLQGCDYAEVAAVTGAALGTVKSRLNRARARLRQMLRDDPAAGELFERYARLYEER
jgi:RNA polymerase sigma-70 factor (ECF subfamily)